MMVDAELILKVSLLAHFGRKYRGLSLDSFKFRSMGEFVKPLALHCVFPDRGPFHVQPIYFPPEFSEEQVRTLLTTFVIERVEDVANGHPDPFDDWRSKFKTGLFARLYSPTLAPYSDAEREIAAVLDYPLPERKVPDTTRVTRDSVMFPTVMNKKMLPADTELAKRLLADFEGKHPDLKHLVTDEAPVPDIRADFAEVEMRLWSEIGLKFGAAHPDNPNFQGSMTGRLPREPEFLWPTKADVKSTALHVVDSLPDKEPDDADADSGNS